ncbi:MAG: chorismate mutase, partial [Candidatus Hydrogenedens sp.]
MNINELRKKIDEIDQKIISLLNERAYCAQEIGKIKSGSQAPFYVPEREKSVIEKLLQSNHGP